MINSKHSSTPRGGASTGGSSSVAEASSCTGRSVLERRRSGDSRWASQALHRRTENLYDAKNALYIQQLYDLYIYICLGLDNVRYVYQKSLVYDATCFINMEITATYPVRTYQICMRGTWIYHLFASMTNPEIGNKPSANHLTRLLGGVSVGVTHV